MVLKFNQNEPSKFDQLKPLLNFAREKEVSSIDLLTVSGVFCVISNKRRKELTKTSAINPKVKIEVNEDREFRTSKGNHVIISGPVLSHYDATIASILIAIYFDNECNSGQMTTNYTEIAKKLGKERPGGSVREDIYRALARLRMCNIMIYDDDGAPLWARSLINDFKTEGTQRGLQLIITLNEWIVPQFNSGRFSTQQLSRLTALSGEYQPALYRLLTTDGSPVLNIKLSQLYNYLIERGIRDVSYDNLTPKKQENFRTLIKKNLKMMVKKGIVHPDSSVGAQNIVLINVAD